MRMFKSALNGGSRCTMIREIGTLMTKRLSSRANNAVHILLVSHVNDFTVGEMAPQSNWCEDPSRSRNERLLVRKPGCLYDQSYARLGYSIPLPNTNNRNFSIVKVGLLWV